MSSYSSTSLSSYDPATSSSTSVSSSDFPSSPSISPSSSPPSPHSLKRPTSFPKLRTQPAQQSQASQGLGHWQRSRALTLDVRSREIGVGPTALVGKQLTRVSRSRDHPCLTLQFADGSAFQVRVDGYDPHHPGVPKVLESDSPVLNPQQSVDVRLTVVRAVTITLSDKAFQLRRRPSAGMDERSPSEGEKEDRWTQRHAAFALRFAEEPGWHCVWATMAEYDERDGQRCVFRNYADVFLDRFPLSPPSSSSSSAATATARSATSPSPTSTPAHAIAFPSGPGKEKKGPTTPRKQRNRRKGKPRAYSTPTSTVC